MAHLRSAEKRMLETVLKAPPVSVNTNKNNPISYLAECLEEILETQGFRLNGKSTLEALDHFESLHFIDVFMNDAELHEMFFDIADYILRDQYQLELLRNTCNERNVYLRKRHLESVTSLGGLMNALSKREMLATALKAYNIDLSPDTVVALARREYRRKNQSIKAGRPETYTIEQLKEMANLEGSEHRVTRSNARQALRRRGVSEEDIPKVVTQYRFVGKE